MPENETPAFGHVEDRRNYEAVLAAGKEPCPRCEGTGNEHFLTYKECEDCGGSGVDPDA